MIYWGKPRWILVRRSKLRPRFKLDTSQTQVWCVTATVTFSLHVLQVLRLVQCHYTQHNILCKKGPSALTRYRLFSTKQHPVSNYRFLLYGYVEFIVWSCLTNKLNSVANVITLKLAIGMHSESIKFCWQPVTPTSLTHEDRKLTG